MRRVIRCMCVPLLGWRGSDLEEDHTGVIEKLQLRNLEKYIQV